MLSRVILKSFYSKKKRKVKSKKKCKTFMHDLVKKMVIMKFYAAVTDKVL